MPSGGHHTGGVRGSTVGFSPELCGESVGTTIHLIPLVRILSTNFHKTKVEWTEAIHPSGTIHSLCPLGLQSGHEIFLFRTTGCCMGASLRLLVDRAQSPV